MTQEYRVPQTQTSVANMARSILHVAKRPCTNIYCFKSNNYSQTASISLRRRAQN